MKIKQITENTTSGSIATVDTALGGTQSRGNPSIYGGKKVGSLFKGKKTKAPYANSINESADLSEAHLEEDDVIVVPGQGRSRKNGFVPHGKSRVDHEVEMARSDLFSAAKNAQQVYLMIKDVGEEEGLDGWVQEKIIKANDYLNTIREYLEGKQVQGMNEGVADMHSNELLNTVRGAIRKAIKETGDQSLSKIFVCLRDARPASEALKNITSPNSLAEVDNALQEVGIDFDDLLDFINKQAEKYGRQGVAEADMNRRGFLKGIGAAMAGAAGIGAASNTHARYTPQWMEKVEQAKELLAKGFTPDQIAKKLGVTGPNNGMAGPMNGDWGAINYAVQQVKRTGMQEGKRNLKCACKTHGQDQCPIHAPIDEASKSDNKNKKA